MGSSNEFAQGIAKQHGGKVLQTHDAVLKGFAIYLPDVAGTAFVEAMKKSESRFS